LARFHSEAYQLAASTGEYQDASKEPNIGKFQNFAKICTFRKIFQNDKKPSPIKQRVLSMFVWAHWFNCTQHTQTFPMSATKRRKVAGRSVRQSTVSERFRVSDDIEILRLCSQGYPLHVIPKLAQFTQPFSTEDVTARWDALLHDQQLADTVTRQIAVFLDTQNKRVPWTKPEDDLIMKFFHDNGTMNFELMLDKYRGVFHPSRSIKSLEAHFYKLRRSGKLPDPEGFAAPTVGPGSRKRARAAVKEEEEEDEEDEEVEEEEEEEEEDEGEVEGEAEDEEHMDESNAAAVATAGATEGDDGDEVEEDDEMAEPMRDFSDVEEEVIEGLSDVEGDVDTSVMEASAREQADTLARLEHQHALENNAHLPIQAHIRKLTDSSGAAQAAQPLRTARTLFMKDGTARAARYDDEASHVPDCVAVLIYQSGLFRLQRTAHSPNFPVRVNDNEVNSIGLRLVMNLAKIRIGDTVFELHITAK
jgi:hypothetical protein